MKTNKRRVVSIALAFMMVMSLFAGLAPAKAYAAGTINSFSVNFDWNKIPALEKGMVLNDVVSGGDAFITENPATTSENVYIENGYYGWAIKLDASYYIDDEEAADLYEEYGNTPEVADLIEDYNEIVEEALTYYNGWHQLDWFMGTACKLGYEINEDDTYAVWMGIIAKDSGEFAFSGNVFAGTIDSNVEVGDNFFGDPGLIVFFELGTLAEMEQEKDNVGGSGGSDNVINSFDVQFDWSKVPSLTKGMTMEDLPELDDNNPPATTKGVILAGLGWAIKIDESFYIDDEEAVEIYDQLGNEDGYDFIKNYNEGIETGLEDFSGWLPLEAILSAGEVTGYTINDKDTYAVWLGFEPENGKEFPDPNANGEFPGKINSNVEVGASIYEGGYIVFFELGTLEEIAEEKGETTKPSDPASKITLSAEKGSKIEGDIVVDEDGVVRKLPIAKRDGYKFLGWFDKDGNQVKVGDTVLEEVTLYAKWQKIDAAPQTGDESNMLPIVAVMMLVAAAGAVTALRRKEN